jgi:hypothetical protein
MGPILDKFVVSYVAVGALCEELGRRLNIGLLCPFTTPGKGPPLCLLGYTTTGL